MASVATSLATSQLQKASQQYLECRRKVSAKADEVKLLESQIQDLFATSLQMQTACDDVKLLKSVGKMELIIVALEGKVESLSKPVIKVDIDPEYEDEEEEDEVMAPRVHVVNEEEQEEDEAKELKEEKVAEEQEEQQAEKEDKQGTEDTEKTEKKDVAEPVEKKLVVERVVAWDEATELPVKFVFDPVQSREAVVTLSVLSGEETADGDVEEALKEFEFPVSSLFESGKLDKWFVVEESKEEEKEEVKEEAKDPVKDEEPKTSIEEVEDKLNETEEEPKEDKTLKEEDVQEEDPVEKEAATEADASKEADNEEAVEEETSKKEGGTTEQEMEVAQDDEVKKEDISVRFHVQATFELSEIEKINVKAIALSKKKQEAEAALRELESEATSLRAKYERITASQRSATSVSKARTNALGGRIGAGVGQPRPQKSTWERTKDSIGNFFTPQLRQNLFSVGLFVGCSLLFHYEAENLGIVPV